MAQTKTTAINSQSKQSPSVLKSKAFERGKSLDNGKNSKITHTK
jgi:hypothetical protein